MLGILTITQFQTKSSSGTPFESIIAQIRLQWLFYTTVWRSSKEG